MALGTLCHFGIGALPCPPSLSGRSALSGRLSSDVRVARRRRFGAQGSALSERSASPNTGLHASPAAVPVSQTRRNSGVSHTQIWTPLPLLSRSLQFILVQKSRKGVSPHLRPALRLPSHDSCRRRTEPNSRPEWGASGNNRPCGATTRNRGFRGLAQASEPPALLGRRPGPDTMGDPVFQWHCNFRRCLCVGFLNQDTGGALGLGSGRRAATETCWALARWAL